MSVLVPYALNLFKNPKPASLSGIDTGGGASDPLLVYDRSYSGDTSAKITFTTLTHTAEWLTNTSTDFAGEVTGEEQTFYVKFRLLTLTGVDLDAQSFILYSDATTDLGTPQTVDLDPSATWNIISLEGVEADTAKTISAVGIALSSNLGTSQTFYLGGADARSNQTVDGFVVGDGQRSSWVGTPNASASEREAYEMNVRVRRGAQIRYQAKYFLVDRQNVVQDEITDFVMPGPSISVDMLGEATKSVLTIGMTRNDVVLPFRDQWISPRLTIEHPDGTVEGGDGVEGMLGLYSVEPASERYDATGNFFSYAGYDLLWLMEQETIQPQPGSTTLFAPQGSGYVLGSGYSFREFLRTVFRDGGFREENGMLFLPPGGPVSVHPWGSEVGTSRLDFITKTCDAMGWRRPWITLQGQATTGPKVDLSQVEPDYIFESGDNSDVRWPFEVEPEPENMANRVRVFGKWYGKLDAINIVVENDDPSHPFSTVSLGQKDENDNLVRKRYIDAPQIDKGVLFTHAEAQTYGLADLAERGMLPYTVRMRTRAMICQLNSVYDLNITDAEGGYIDNGQGKYWCVGWQMSLGAPWEMTHNLRRLIPIFDTEYGPSDIVHKYPVPIYTKDMLKKLNKEIKKLLAGKPTKKEENEAKALKKERNKITAGLKRGDVAWVES